MSHTEVRPWALFYWFSGTDPYFSSSSGKMQLVYFHFTNSCNELPSTRDFNMVLEVANTLQSTAALLVELEQHPALEECALWLRVTLRSTPFKLPLEDAATLNLPLMYPMFIIAVTGETCSRPSQTLVEPWTCSHKELIWCYTASH